MDMAHYLVNRLNFNEFPRNLFEYLEKHMDYEDGSSLFKIMDIASSIGVKASHGKVTRDILESLFESDKEVVEIAKLIAMAEYELNGKNYKGACSVLVDIIRYCRNAKFDMGSLISRIHSIAGDMYYGEGKKEKARRSYKKSAHNFIGERKTFEYGWSNYRLGLLADNAMEAAKYFNIAYEAFKNVQYEKLSSKSKGELAVTMVEQGQLLSFMNIAEEISNKYYIENNQEYAIACAIILGQVTRLTYMVKDEKIQILKEEYTIVHQMN
jgi:tetratricopeptide (TPR) repeat protein